MFDIIPVDRNSSFLLIVVYIYYIVLFFTVAELVEDRPEQLDIFLRCRVSISFYRLPLSNVNF